MPSVQVDRFCGCLQFLGRTGFSYSPEETREAHIPAQYPSPCQEAWFSRPHGYGWWTKRFEGPSPEGPCPSLSLTPAFLFDMGSVRRWRDRFVSRRYLGGLISKRCPALADEHRGGLCR